MNRIFKIKKAVGGRGGSKGVKDGKFEIEDMWSETPPSYRNLFDYCGCESPATSSSSISPAVP
jgi:hypothetical protein